MAAVHPPVRNAWSPLNTNAARRAANDHVALVKAEAGLKQFLYSFQQEGIHLLLFQGHSLKEDLHLIPDPGHSLKEDLHLNLSPDHSQGEDSPQNFGLNHYLSSPEIKQL